MSDTRPMDEALRQLVEVIHRFVAALRRITELREAGGMADGELELVQAAIASAEAGEFGAGELMSVLSAWVVNRGPHRERFPWAFVSAARRVLAGRADAAQMIDLAEALAQCQGECGRELAHHRDHVSPSPVCVVLIDGAAPAGEVVTALVERGGYEVIGEHRGPLTTLASPEAEPTLEQLAEAMMASRSVLVPAVSVRGSVLIELLVVARVFGHRAVVVLPPEHDDEVDAVSAGWAVVAAESADDPELDDLI
jgi:hypothetical protein